jgi:site-specific recombinase XerC
MRKVAKPRLAERVPAPFKANDAKRQLACCHRETPIGARNRSIVLTLLDSGLRAAEFVPLRVGGLDTRSGLATIMGKGRKQRSPGRFKSPGGHRAHDGFSSARG